MKRGTQGGKIIALSLTREEASIETADRKQRIEHTRAENVTQGGSAGSAGSASVDYIYCSVVWPAKLELG